ncbi:ferritin-like protein [Streptomyces scabiei]|uniref:ferritin-like domain-containing protein n=1 Tax=Streptomyces scabiei TaxID=1930 RepID=UPI0029900A79|nr:ferritin-like protein [Streptomyces scabiei]MDW8803740.1 ferritin-like protein [Streptomyces scabiei]
MDEPAGDRGREWLEESLQQAVMLELATLPPYLCAMWSIEDQDSDVAMAIRRIAFDEMSHLGLAGNLLTTIDGVPRLADERTVPSYPGPLPGGVRPGLTVFLSGLTKESLDLFARIEEPEHPLAEAASHTSIGAFYSAVLEVFRNHPELIIGARQLRRPMSHHGEGNDVVGLTTLADVEKAIGVIKEQGEGTTASPVNPHPGEEGELAHYYVFRELFHGQRLIRTSQNPDRWEFAGDEIPMPAVLPMGTVPAGGWEAGGLPAPDPETKQQLDAVNRAYSDMLRLMERAWQSTVPATANNLLGQAIGKMFSLVQPSRSLMRRELPDGSGKTYGPEFRFVDA